MSPLGEVLLACGFVISYTILAFAGLTMQSAQTGVTPIWPSSGIALAFTYWFGLRYALLVLPAMLSLAWLVGVPLPVAVFAGLGSVAEAAVAVALLRRLHVDPSLMQLRDTLLFVVFAAVLAPMISAGVGTLAMSLYATGSVQSVLVAAMWWLGNSIGVLVIGGLGLVLPGPKVFPLYRYHWLELIGLCLLALLITWLGIERVNTVTSALVICLLLPLIVVAGLRMGQFGVLTTASVVLFTLMMDSDRLPHAELGSMGLGLLYLDITLIWMASFTGLVVGSARQESRRREEVSWLASHDVLTDLVNRHEMTVRLARALEAARKYDLSHAMLLIDLDHFKHINDIEGHLAGDNVLRDIARLLQAEVRARDTVARTGGDEFAVLLEICPLVEACGIAENIRRSLEAYRYHGEHGDYSIAASIGVVELDDGVPDAAAVMHGADLACHEAKRGGRNRVWVGAAATRSTPRAAD